jgi:transcriptional regulator with XRE-family HTH domain
VPSEPPEAFVIRVTRRIAEIRRARGMTQEEVAVALRTATRNVQRIEAGQNLTLHTLARLAAVLGARPEELIIDDRPMSERRRRAPRR